MRNHFMQKIWALFLSLLMMLGNLQCYVNAEGEDDRSDVTMQVTLQYSKDQGKDGSYQDFPTDGSMVTLKQGDYIRASIRVTPTNNNKKQDYRIPLAPVNISIQQTKELILYEDGKEAGTYQIVVDNDGTPYVKIHLNDDVVNESNITAGVEAIGVVTIDRTKDNDKKENVIEIAGNKTTILFDANRKTSSATITKSNLNRNVYKGEDGSYYQDYEIDITANDGDITLDSLLDVFGGQNAQPAGLKYTDPNGTIEADSFETLNSQIQNRVLTEKSTARITYSLCVASASDIGKLYKNNSQNAENYRNRVNLTYRDDNNDSHTTTDATADLKVTYPSVSKSGKYDKERNVISWDITVNANDFENLPGYVEGKIDSLIQQFKDTLGSHQSYTEKEPTLSDFIYNKEKKQYTCHYETSVDPNFDISGGATLQNDVDITTVNGQDYQAHGTATIETGNLISKSFESVDFVNRLLTWKVSIHVYPGMTSLTLNDWTSIADNQNQGKHEMDPDRFSLWIDGDAVVQSGTIVDNTKIDNINDIHAWGSSLMFRDAFIQGKQGKTIELVYTTYAGDDLIDNATYVNNASLSYKDVTGTGKTTETVSASWKNHVDLYLDKKAEVNDSKDQIDYSIRSNLMDLDSVSADKKIILTDIMNNDKFTLDPSSIQVGYYFITKWNQEESRFLSDNNGGKISIWSWAKNANYQLDAPAFQYDQSTHQYRITLPQSLVDLIQEQKTMKDPDFKQFGIYLSYSVKPKDPKTFVKNNQTETVQNTVSETYDGKDYGTRETITEISPKKTVDKTGTTKDATGKDSIYAYYTVKVNPQAYTFNNGNRLTGEDVMSQNLTYDLSSITVTKTVDGKEIAVEKGKEDDQFDYHFDVEHNSLLFSLPDAVSLTIRYRAVISAKFGESLDGKADNAFTLKAHNETEAADSHSFAGIFTKPSGWVVSDSGTIKVLKTDNTDGQPLSDATFEIWQTEWDCQNKKMIDREKVGSYTTDKNGSIKVKGLEFDRYYVLYETNSPSGYAKYTEPYYFILPSDKSAPAVDPSAVTVHTFYNYSGMITIADDRVTDKLGQLTIQKISQGAETPASTQFIVESEAKDDQNNPVYRKIINYSQFADGSYQLSNLPLGKYTIREVTDTAMVNNKTLSVKLDGQQKAGEEITIASDDLQKTVRFVNEYTSEPAGITCSGKKIWNDDNNKFGKRPESITVNLLKNGEKYRSEDVSADKDGNWEYSFMDLPESENGIAIDYSVNEELVNGYTVSYDNGTIVNTLNTKTISVSKTDITGTKELSGARLEIVDAKNRSKVYESWTTDGTVHQVNLPAGSYELVETKAPENYKIAESISFTVSEDLTLSLGNGESCEDNMITMKDDYAEHSVSIRKEDFNGKVLVGARLTVSGRANGSEADIEPITWTSSEKDHEIALKPGYYILHEESAPAGYTLAGDILFTVDENGTVRVNDEIIDRVTMQDSETVVRIGKADSNDGHLIAGAHLQILDGETVVTEWESDTEAYEVKGLKAGVIYTLRETSAPAGYLLAEDSQFTVNKDGTVTTSLPMREDGAVLVEDQPISSVSYTVRKDWNDNGVLNFSHPDFVHVRLVDTDSGKTVQEVDLSQENNWTYTWTDLYRTDAAGKEIRYAVSEDGIDGYNATVSSSVDENGSVFTTVTNTYSEGKSVVISKQDISGNRISGAQLSVLDQNGAEIADWTSLEGQDRKLTLVPGTYVLHETAAPKGYDIADDMVFTVDETGTVTVDGKSVETVTMVDQESTYPVTIHKQDLHSGKQLSDAKLSITDEEGKKVDEWISGQDGKNEDGTLKPHTLALPAGSYTLHEFHAPDGYRTAKDICFEVTKDGSILVDGSLAESVIMKDARRMPTVYTGDRNNIPLSAFTGIVSLAVVLAVFLFRKKNA